MFSKRCLWQYIIVVTNDFTLYENHGNVLCQLYKCPGNLNSTVGKTKQNKLMLVSNCAACGKKNKDLLKIQK